MSNTSEYIKSVTKEEHIDKLVSSLKKYYANPVGIIKSIIGKKGSLSRDNASLGLLLLNKHVLFSEENDYYYGVPEIEQGSKRFNELITFGEPNEYWSADNFKLLQFLFGDRIALLVRTAWRSIPTLMYQTGYDRRSFRSSGHKYIYFTRQLNFVLNLIQENRYDMTLEEYIIYGNDIYANHFSYLYAAAIDSGDSSITQLCLDAVYGRDERAKPSRAIIKGMLLSQNKECWIAVEKLLISAQRQEGLRQTILECLDETSLGAMKYMIKVILDNKLTRFSSVVRAIDTWAGFGWNSEKEPTVRRFLQLADKFLSEPDDIKSAVKSKDNAEVYMALWAQGVIDVSTISPLIDEVLKGDNEKISLVLYFLSQVCLSNYSIEFGKRFYLHSDNVISCQAIELINFPNFIKSIPQKDKDKMFVELELLLRKYSKKKVVTNSWVFSWLTFNSGSAIVVDLMINLLNLDKEKDIDKILPYYNDMGVDNREDVTRRILSEYSYYNYNKSEKRKKLSKKKRDFALSILKDRSESIKETALRALENSSLSEDEVLLFESLLTRKSAEFRKSAIKLLTEQKLDIVQSSAIRLISAKTEEQRVAGLDLLIWIKNNSSESNAWLSERVKEFTQRKSISSKEEILLKGLDDSECEKVEFNQDNGFGLYNIDVLPTKFDLDIASNGELTASRQKNIFGLSMSEVEVNKALLDLKELLLNNKEYEYTVEGWDGHKTTCLLGNDFYKLKFDTSGMTPEQKFNNYPLSDVWDKWYKESGLTTRDIFLINLQSNTDRSNLGNKAFSSLNKKISKFLFIPKIPEIGEYSWQNPIYAIITALSEYYIYSDRINFLSDTVLEIFNSIGDSDLTSYKKIDSYWNDEYETWRDQKLIANVWNSYTNLNREMSPEQYKVYWTLAQWYYLTSPDIESIKKTYLPGLYDYARAFKEGYINKDSLMWRILKSDSMSTLTKKVSGDQYDIIREFTFLEDMVCKCRSRILEIELIRGDSSTSATHLAKCIDRLYGTDYFVNILNAMGKDTLYRGYIYSYGDREYTKKEILSTLLKRCYPDECSQKDFNLKIEKANLSEKRLCEAASYSPQWLPLVSGYLGWKNMESAVWWLHAHTNGEHNSQTESEISKYSSVEITSFKDGAVDISWFKEVYKSLGKERWKKLYDSAKYITDGSGHKRAHLYSDVILGNTKITEVTERITSKRNQDYLRVYGVIPLNKRNPANDVLRRYQFLQNFKKESKQFGSQRQASESTATRIAMENLARTASYDDPVRLQWAMETKEAREILKNASVVAIDDTEIRLEIDINGKSSVVSIKNGKKLKSVPAKYKKHNDVVKLKEFNKTLNNQYRRTRKSLENAMVNGDVFTKDEIENLLNHPVVAPMLQKLVFVSDNKIGFITNEGLLTSNDEIFDLGENVRIAHCVDMFEAQLWSYYQKYSFRNKLIQPFRQIYRELYLPTEDELKENTISRRYAGHQVQPRKTVALLKSQYWTVDYDEGLQKVNHKHNVISRMYAMADWFSPADVESPTLETIEFIDRKSKNSLPIVDIDKRIFSETMRDIDLVVSVAHVGDVDPEATQSSIELRSVIIEETCKLFKLNNVNISGSHAKIKGELGDYSVHLGSGVCHKLAGSSLSIIPVHSQHRGRMFLPFLDDDPKTAEIMSKVLLLAKDNEIKDPTILRQL